MREDRQASQRRGYLMMCRVGSSDLAISRLYRSNEQSSGLLGSLSMYQKLTVLKSIDRTSFGLVRSPDVRSQKRQICLSNQNDPSCLPSDSPNFHAQLTHLPDTICLAHRRIWTSTILAHPRLVFSIRGPHYEKTSKCTSYQQPQVIPPYSKDQSTARALT